MMNKILGYVLLAVGLALIIGSVWQSYNIFTAKASAPLVFKTPASAPAPASNKAKTLEQQLQLQMDQALQSQLTQILPANSIIGLLNLISWSIFSGVLILAGGTLSTLGIKLIK